MSRSMALPYTLVVLILAATITEAALAWIFPVQVAAAFSTGAACKK